jgi:hypothetical protein
MADVSPRKIAELVLAPVLCTALLLLGVLTLVLGWGVTSDRTMDHADVDYVYLLGTVILSGLAAVAAYRIAGLLRARGWWPVLAVLVPAVVFTVLQLDKAFGKRDSALVWLAGLLVVLVVAAVLARRGLLRQAWIVGVLGVIIVADVAVLAQLLHSSSVDGDQVQQLDRAYAPLWFVFALIDYDFGLDPLSWHIGDSLDMREVGYPMYSMIAIGYAVRAMRRDPAAADTAEDL